MNFKIIQQNQKLILNMSGKLILEFISDRK